MRPQEFIPVVGVPIGLHRILTSYNNGSMSFYEAAQESATLGFTQFVFTTIGMNTNYLSAMKVMRTTQLATNPTTAVATLGVAAVATQTKLAETFAKTETAKDPWWLAFVSGLSD